MTPRFKTILCAGLLVGAVAGAQPTTAPSAAPGAPATPETAPGAQPHAGFFKAARGDVRLLSADGATRPVKPGDRVLPIDRITTGADGGGSLVLRDGTTLVLGPNSRVDLKQFHFDGTTQEGSLFVSLLRGSLRMVTGLIGKAQPDAVRVETQTATIGIRGTDFIVTSDAQP